MPAQLTYTRPRELLLSCLAHPSLVINLSEIEWDMLLPLTRHSKLMGRLAERLIQLGIFNRLPARVQDHLIGSMRLTEHRQRMVLWEINRLERALKTSGTTVLVLKGGAYILARLSAGSGRLLADVDILVAHNDLDTIEKLLLSQGWEAVQLDDYDEHYYRAWMHEIPPLRHRDRCIEVDVHHTVLPVSSRYKPNPELLLTEARPVEGCQFKVLAPCDMILHSAAHLFLDGEFVNGLRDLSDIDLLLREFSQKDSRFWTRLLHRAAEMKLTRPLFYALRYTRRMLKTPVPRRAVVAAEFYSPGRRMARIMDALFERALMPDIPDVNDRWTPLARRLLLMRSHWLKMPPALLAYHTFRKSVKRWRPSAPK